VTIIRQVTTAGEPLASKLPTSPVSSSGLVSVVRPAPADLLSLPLIRRPVLAVPAPVGLAPGGSSTPRTPIQGPSGTGVTPVSAWMASTATLGAPSRWGLPPPRASTITTAAAPPAVAATGVLAGSSAGPGAAPSASAPAPVNSPPELPPSGYSSAAGSSSAFAFFLLLAGLLALAAPWVRRLPRPSGRLRGRAPFVLIPERPG
jgi:hypothetical protein